jgi:dolichol-phosphate mannosyltransferase
MKALIVLPSYNERSNILELITAILSADGSHEVCVVDDSSPDGTAGAVAQASAERELFQKRVHLIVRSKKDGRGGAVRDGLAWGVAEGRFEAFIEMDCDFSHEPSAIREGLALLASGYDVAIGARYPRGTIVGWPLVRRVFSFFANSLARALIDSSVNDYTNGFRFYRLSAVEALLAHEQRHKGYIYLSETMSILLRRGLQVASFPIYFKNRERGISNTSLREIRSALGGVLSIAWRHHTSPR